MKPRAVVIGPPGAGKTTVGEALASMLRVSFYDTDRAVETAEGRTIADIFVTDGEAAFRALEQAAVLAALTEQDGVVAVGGGAPIQPKVNEALRGHTVVFLDVGIADAARRIGFDASRPLLAVNPRASWVAMMAQRRPVYEQVAFVRVDTAGRTVADVAAEAARLVRATLTDARSVEANPEPARGGPGDA